MAKSKFQGRFRNEVDPTDPVVLECKRKVPYPTRHMAEKDLFALRMKGDDVHIYTCRHCSKFHIGHIPKFGVEEEKEPEVVVVKPSYQPVAVKVPKPWLPKTTTPENIELLDVTDYAKLVDDFRNIYIFKMPHEMPHTESNVLEHGVLMATKKGDDWYKEADGSRSPQSKWKAYHRNLPPIFIRSNVVDFQKRIAVHLDRALYELPQQNFKNNLIKEKLLAASVKPKSNGDFRGHPVIRDQKGNPFIETLRECHCCRTPMKFRARIYEKNGQFTTSGSFFPLEDKAAQPKTKGSSTWLCGNCANPSLMHDEEVVQEVLAAHAEEFAEEFAEEEAAELEPMPEQPAVAPPTRQPLRLEMLSSAEKLFLTELEGMILDPTVNSARFRGMAYVAVKVLSARLAA